MYKVSLAPMAGMADRAYRLICKSHGAEYLTTEMISAKAVCYGDKKTFEIAEMDQSEMPEAIQIFGSEPEFMGKGAYLLLEHASKKGITPSAIDINMGCPVPKITRNGEGSSLMKNPGLAGRIIDETIKNTSGIPVTVKMRLGWDSTSINVVEFAKMAETHGASSICIHARTKEQMYSPSADWSWIAKVKQQVSIPVVGNGDIFDGNDAVNMFKQTNCDAVAVARGALGNPWIFEDIRDRLEGKTPKNITKSIRINEAIRYLKLAVELKGEEKGVIESRKILGFFVKGLYGSPRVRNLINLTSNEKDMTELLLSMED